MQTTKYCADCGAVIAGADTPPRRYNAIKYCPACARERKLWSNANSQTRHRRDKKERNRLQREQNALLREENALLRARVAALEKMNQELRGFV